MVKSNHVANEAQLKARRTSLEKKDYDELINIILRKDSTERKNNAKIQELQALIKEADELNEEKATRILGFEKDMEGMQELVKVKQEQIDKLLHEKNILESEVTEWSKKYNKCNSALSIYTKAVGICICIIAILGLLLLV